MTPRPAALALLGSIAIAGLLAGCSASGNTSDASFTPNVTTDVPAAANEVDNVRWNLPNGEPTSLDPALSAVESNSTVVGNLCEALLTPTVTGENLPGLATSVERTDDVTYVIQLREGVTFWDGAPMTAEDVVFSIERVLQPELGSSWAGWSLQGVDSVEATGDLEVTVVLSSPNALLEQYFATPAFTVVEKAFAERAGTSFGTAEGGVMCTGPYKLEEWKSGSGITIQRNDGWWNTEASPKVSQYTFSFTTDPAAQAAALRSGDLDGSWGVPVSQYKNLDGIGTLLFSDSYAMEFVPVINLEGALGDPKVRQALQQSINYDGIAEKIYLGTADPLRAIVPPSAWGYSEAVFQEGYDALPAAETDTDSAKALLEESGYDGAPVVLAYYSASEEESKMATVIADGANAIGMDVQLKPLESAAFFGLFSDDPQARAGIDAFVTAGYLDFPEPAQYYQYLTTGNYYNFAGYSNPEYDEAIAAAIAEFDDDARAADVVAAQSIVTLDYVALPLVSQYVSLYYSDQLAGLAPSARYLYYPWGALLGGK